MAEHIARMAATGVINQGGTRIKITREAIESMVSSVDSQRALPFIVEHDPSCMPIGKVTELWAEPFENEYAAMGRVYMEESARAITHVRSGMRLVCLDFAEAPQPFVRKPRGDIDSALAIAVDRANLSGCPKSRGLCECCRANRCGDCMQRNWSNIRLCRNRS